MCSLEDFFPLRFCFPSVPVVVVSPNEPIGKESVTTFERRSFLCFTYVENIKTQNVYVEQKCLKIEVSTKKNFVIEKKRNRLFQ
jgi:hypothetical protein